jgi:hypothetical protein
MKTLQPIPLQPRHSALSALTSILLAAPLVGFNPVLAQTVDFSSCSSTECRFSQTTGTTNSVSVGVTSSIGSASSAQGSLHHNASSKSAVSLQGASGVNSSLFGKNTSYQAIGGSFVDVIGSDGGFAVIDGERQQSWQSSPVNIAIDTSTTKSLSKDGSLLDRTIEVDAGSEVSSENTEYSDNSNSGSVANFTAEGLAAYQDLKLTGESDGSSGTYASTAVEQLVQRENGIPIYENVPLKDSDGNVLTQQVPLFNTDGTAKTVTVMIVDSDGAPVLNSEGQPLYEVRQVYQTEVIYEKKLVGYEPTGNPIIVDGYGSGSSNASVSTSTRFSADITSSNFVNAFMSSF